MIFIYFAAVLLVILLFWYTRKRISSNIDYLKTCCEILAFISAAGYFIYQLTGNYYITDGSLDLTCNRQKIKTNDSLDYLALNLKFSKGATASLDILWIKGYIYNADLNEIIDSMYFDGYKRYNNNAPYRVAANETTEFSKCVKVPRESPLRVEVELKGKRSILFHSVQPEFRVSEVSLPVK